MKPYRITSVSDLGQVVRAVRKTSGLRQDDLAGSAGVSHVYVRDLERGKATAQIGLALQVMSEFGIDLFLDISNDAYERLQRDKTQALPGVPEASEGIHQVPPREDQAR